MLAPDSTPLRLGGVKLLLSSFSLYVFVTWQTNYFVPGPVQINRMSGLSVFRLSGLYCNNELMFLQVCWKQELQVSICSRRLCERVFQLLSWIYKKWFNGEWRVVGQIWTHSAIGTRVSYEIWNFSSPIMFILDISENLAGLYLSGCTQLEVLICFTDVNRWYQVLGWECETSYILFLKDSKK